MSAKRRKRPRNIVIAIFSHGWYDIDIKDTDKPDGVEIVQLAAIPETYDENITENGETMNLQMIKVPGNFDLEYQNTGLPPFLSVHRNTDATMDKLYEFWDKKDNTIIEGVMEKIKKENIKDWNKVQDRKVVRSLLPPTPSKRVSRIERAEREKRKMLENERKLYDLIGNYKNTDTMLRKKYSTDSIQTLTSKNGKYRGGIYLFMDPPTTPDCIPHPNVYPLLSNPYHHSPFGNAGDRLFCSMEGCEARLKSVPEFSDTKQQNAISHFFKGNVKEEKDKKLILPAQKKDHHFTTSTHHIIKLLGILFPHENIKLTWLDFSCNSFDKLKYKQHPIPASVHSGFPSFAPGYTYENPAKAIRLLKKLFTKKVAFGNRKTAKVLKKLKNK